MHRFPMIKHKIILDLATTMASLGELLTDQEINLMMGEAGAADGKVTLSSITLVTLSRITWPPCQASLGHLSHLVKHHPGHLGHLLQRQEIQLHQFPTDHHC